MRSCWHPYLRTRRSDALEMQTRTLSRLTPQPRYRKGVLSGLVIQYDDTVLSEGMRTSFESWPVVLKFKPSGRSERSEVGRVAGLGRMALGLDRQVADKLVAGLDAVFEEEAVTHVVVGHVVLDLQVVRAVHGHAAVVGVVDRRVPDVLPFARHRPGASESDSGQVPGSVRCGSSSTPSTNILLVTIAMM